MAAHIGVAGSLVVPEGLDSSWIDALVASHFDRRHEQDLNIGHDGPGGVEGIERVVTSAAVAIATTATIVLDHG